MLYFAKYDILILMNTSLDGFTPDDFRAPTPAEVGLLTDAIDSRLGANDVVRHSKLYMVAPAEGLLVSVTATSDVNPSENVDTNTLEIGIVSQGDRTEVPSTLTVQNGHLGGMPTDWNVWLDGISLAHERERSHTVGIMAVEFVLALAKLDLRQPEVEPLLKPIVQYHSQQIRQVLAGKLAYVRSLDVYTPGYLAAAPTIQSIGADLRASLAISGVPHSCQQERRIPDGQRDDSGAAIGVFSVATSFTDSRGQREQIRTHEIILTSDSSSQSGDALGGTSGVPAASVRSLRMTARLAPKIVETTREADLPNEPFSTDQNTSRDATLGDFKPFRRALELAAG